MRISETWEKINNFNNHHLIEDAGGIILGEDIPTEQSKSNIDNFLTSGSGFWIGFLNEEIIL